MTARFDIALAALLAACVALPARAVVLTGEVRSDGSQAVYTPPSNSSPVVLRYYLPDGTRVKKGDVLLRIDAGQAASQLRTLKDQIETARATAAKEVADLELKQVDAELALVDAEAKRDTAAVDAALPKSLLSALDYDRYQGAYDSAKRDADLKRSDLAAARAAVERRRKDGALEVQKLEEQLGYNQATVDAATVRASMDGLLVHAFQTFSIGSDGSGGRYEEGSSSFPGNKVGEVVAAGGHSVRAWALAPDRRGLKTGQKVRLSFDALPGHVVTGSIHAIAGAPEEKSEWGDGRYYAIDIALDAAAEKLPLLPGMSVRVDTEPTDDIAPSVATATDGTLHAEGDIYPQQSVAISPPQVEGLWMMNVTQMATDGEPVKKGQPIVVFAGGDLLQQLPSKQSELKEKQRTQEKLRLELADRARTTSLATAQARADAEKAARKAEQPQAYVPGVEYKKLIIDRERTAKRLEITLRREKVDAAAREAEQHQADVAVAQLQRNVAEMQDSVGKLTVLAPRDGLFVHHDSWNGGKIDTGSQVWRGQSVAEIPDMATLAVRASLPERDLERVHVGQLVRVVLTGGASSTLSGHIAEIGTSVHSKSRVEPVPVIDLRITIDPG
jgi:multidrug resistance efflux pump